MKINLSFLITTFLFAFSYGQTLEWEKSFGGTNDEELVKHLDAANGNYVFTGSTLSNDGDLSINYGLKDVFLTKIDTNGNYLWKKVIGGNNDDVPLSMVNSNDGGTVLLSKSKSTTNFFNVNKGNNDLWITKFDGDGNIIWNKPLAGSGDESKAEIISVTNGYILAVTTNSADFDFAHSSVTGKDVWIVRLDESGNILWKKLLQGSLDEEIVKIKKIDDSNFVVVINSSSADGDYTANTATNVYKGFIIKMDINQNILLSSKIESSNIQQPNFINDVKVVGDGYLVGGRESIPFVSGNTTYENYDALFAKVSAAGILLWKKTYSSNGPEYDEVLFVEESSDNKSLFFGIRKYSGFINDSWVMKIDNDGNIIQRTSLGLSYIQDVNKLPTGNFVLNRSYTNFNIPGSIGQVSFMLSFVNSIGTSSSNYYTIKSNQYENLKKAFSSVTNDGKIVSFWQESGRTSIQNPPLINVWFSKFKIPEFILSIEELKKEKKEIVIYPNPTSDFIKISEKMEMLIFYDISGKEILRVKDTDTADLRSLTSGIYILQAYNKRISKSFKIIKK